MKQHDRTDYLRPVLEHVDNLEKQTINTVGEAIGTELLLQMKIHDDSDFLQILLTFPSDLVRSWGAFIVGKDATLPLEQMLDNIKPFAQSVAFFLPIVLLRFCSYSFCFPLAFFFKYIERERDCEEEHRENPRLESKNKLIFAA